MAQVINDPYSGNIFGRLGQGVGQGIGTVLNEEVKIANYYEQKENEYTKKATEHLTKGEQNAPNERNIQPDSGNKREGVNEHRAPTEASRGNSSTEGREVKQEEGPQAWEKITLGESL
jgi:hypothetical protein